jgi:hypothetical protein
MNERQILAENNIFSKQKNQKQITEHLQLLPIPSCLFFLAKIEKNFFNSFSSRMAIYHMFRKRARAHAYMRARIRGASLRIRRRGKA